MIGLWIAAVSAVLAIAAMGALVASRARVGAVAPYSAIGLLAGIAAIACGREAEGFALVGIAALLALTAYATGALVGDPAQQRGTPPRRAAIAAVVTLGLLVACWLYAPALSFLPPPRPAPPAFAMMRGLDLFIALATLVGVAGAAAALLGFGERGVLGEGRR